MSKIATTDALDAVLKLHAAAPNEGLIREEPAQPSPVEQTLDQWRAQLPPNESEVSVASNCDDEQP